MSFSQRACVFLLILSSSQCVDITATGTEGEQVLITCPYAKGYEKAYKGFYKGNYKDYDVILKSNGGETSVSGRISLRDDGKMRSLTVTIRNLKMEDAGPYICRAGYGYLKQIHLNVIRAPQKTRPVQISTSTLHSYTHTSTDHSSTVTPQTESETTRTITGSTAVQLNQPNTSRSSVAGGLGSVLLVLCSGMFLILKKMKRKSGTALFLQHNTESVHMYEIANSDPGSSDVITATSSSNQTPASHLNSRPQVSAVYATVTNQQSDSNPHHARSTNQVTDTDCDFYANMKPPEPTTDNRTELIYSTATHPQNIETNDSQIYSVIKHE
uniref:Immunoglobulin domain-containing protein n=1 Tax=Cyprinus carpio TaxID=7962 RepID=A0A8C2BNF2_CYPCA